MKFKNVKIGDKVWSVTSGWGVISNIYVDDIEVIFREDFKRWYNLKGKFDHRDLYPDLYWHEFPLPKETAPLPDLATDAKVYVKDYAVAQWLPRHFSHFDRELMHTFQDGGTSFTTERTTPWLIWKLKED